MKEKRRSFLLGIASFPLALTVLSITSAYAAPLDQIIAGAKKEGKVVLNLQSDYGAKSEEAIRRLESDIQKAYGVSLKIEFSPMKPPAKEVADMIMQHKAGVPPSYDVQPLDSPSIPLALEAGAIERVNWPSIWAENTNPEIWPQNPKLQGGLIYRSGHDGFMYDPKKFSPADLPKSLKDLADPKWQKKIGILPYPDTWAQLAFLMGKDEMVSALKAIMKNKPTLARRPDMSKLYVLGEVEMAQTTSGRLQPTRDAGKQTGWQVPGFIYYFDYHMVVRTGARHANAAKLVAVYLAGANGCNRITVDFPVRSGNRFYEGNVENDTWRKAKEGGMPVYAPIHQPKLVDFILSDQYEEWQKEFKLIFDTGSR